MIFIYAASRSPAAFELVKALDGTRLRNFDGLDFWMGNKRVVFTEKDVLVPWGSRLPDLDFVRVCNPYKPFKRNWLCHFLSRWSIPTVRAYDHQFEKAAVPRVDKSEGGNDLLFAPVPKPDYWVRLEPFVKVYRVHSFSGKSIRAGLKEVRDGFNLVPADQWTPDERLAHPVVMTHLGGWKINYDIGSTKALRSLAHKVVKTLGLTFAAVDIGEKADGTQLVIKVDPCPKIDGGTVVAYAKSIQRWAMEPEGEQLATVSIPDGDGGAEIIREDQPLRVASSFSRRDPIAVRRDSNLALRRELERTSRIQRGTIGGWYDTANAAISAPISYVGYAAPPPPEPYDPPDFGPDYPDEPGDPV